MLQIRTSTHIMMLGLSRDHHFRGQCVHPASRIAPLILGSSFTSLRAKVTSGTLSMGFCEYLRTVLIVLLAGQFRVSGAAAGSFNLAGSEWGFAGETDRTARFVQFRADGIVGGSSGCNRFTGTYNQEGNELTLGPLASTRMACPPEVMEREQEFHAMLGNVRYAEASHLKLILKDGNGKGLAELVRRDVD